MKAFKTRDLGSLKLFLGISLEWQDVYNVVLHQCNYIRCILERFNAPTLPAATPLDPKLPLVKCHSADFDVWGSGIFCFRKTVITVDENLGSGVHIGAEVKISLSSVLLSRPPWQLGTQQSGA
jgi:hypothetical protein